MEIFCSRFLSGSCDWGREGSLWVALPEGAALGCYDAQTGEQKQKVGIYQHTQL